MEIIIKKRINGHFIQIILENIINNERNETKNSNEEETKYYDNVLQIIENGFTSDYYNTSNIDKGVDDIINTEKLIITLTTSQNQRNNKNNNMTKIGLEDCEILLRDYYNISLNETLYIKKIDIIQDSMKTLEVEYNVYAKLFGKNLINLNLTICEKSKISIFVPFIINDHIDKFNSSSGYYNDICYTTTTEDGTDILLKDRQREFINKDNIICQEDCIFSEYNYDTFEAKCSCKVKECVQSYADMKIDKLRLLDNFKNIKNFQNLNILVCYDKLFNKKGILNNIGFYLIFVIILFHIITILIFKLKEFSLLINKIKKIYSEKHINQSIKKNERDKKYIIFKNKQINVKKIVMKKNIKNKKLKNIENKIIINKNKEVLNDIKIKLNSDIEKCYNDISNDNKRNIKNYIDEEINGFSYNKAIKYDKRTYFQYYESLLRTQHNLISALFNNNNYNSKIIKINLFFIGFTIEYTVNALFYNDDTMHKIYESKGEFDLETQIPITIYSTLISMILNLPLNFLALSNDTIINFKQNNKKINIKKKAKTLKNILIVKFIFYFIISFIFIIFFWYYISMFGVIYKNTQMHLLKDTLISVGLSVIIPFVIYLFPGIFRIISLSNINKKRAYLYNFSKFLQSF